MTARPCGQKGCLRTTNDPSGLCHDHRTQGSQRPFGSAQVPTPVPSGARSVSQVTATSHIIFPDLEGSRVTPEALHSRAMSAVRAAVQTDVHRWFPAISVAGDATSVKESVDLYRRELAGSSRVAPVDFDDVEAGYIASSVVDKFGRGYPDSMAVVSLALRKEWELARARGLSTSPSGRPYPDTPERYVESCATEVMDLADQEVQRQCLRMNEVLSECAAVGNPSLGADFEALGRFQQESWHADQRRAEQEREQRDRERADRARAEQQAAASLEDQQRRAEELAARRARARENRRAAARAVGRGILAIWRATGRSFTRAAEQYERDQYRKDLRRRDRESRDRQELTKLMLKEARRKDRSWF